MLKEHEKKLLQFNHEYNTDTEEDKENLKEGVLKLGQLEESDNKRVKSKKVLTAAHVDAWCQEIKEQQNIGVLRCLLQAFRTACHYGMGEETTLSILTIVNINTFNIIMISILREIDGIFKKLLWMPLSGGKREAILIADLIAERLLCELRILCQIEHPFIVPMTGVLIHLDSKGFDEVYVVYEKMDTTLY